MTEKRRNALMLRWGLISALAFALFWGTWYFVRGEVPMAAPAISMIYAVAPSAGIYLIYKIKKLDPLALSLLAPLILTCANSSGLVICGTPTHGFWISMSIGLSFLLGCTTFTVLGYSVADWLDAYPGGFFWGLFRRATRNRFGSWITARNVNGV